MSVKKKIVVVGGGFGGIYTLKYLHKYLCRDERVQVSLVNEKNYFLFTPLLHEVATGGINPENIVEPVRKVLGCCVDVYLGKAKNIDLKAKTLEVGELILSYDYIVLATGSETNFYDTPGAKENCFILKSIDDAIKIKNRIIAQVERAAHVNSPLLRKKMLNFTVVGGGPTGVELVAEIQELVKDTFSKYYSHEVIDDTKIVLIQKDSEVLPQFGKKVRTKSLEFLRKKGIEVILNTEVREVQKDGVILGNGKKLESETIFWVAGIKPKDQNIKTSVARAKDGRLLVNEYLALPNYPFAFALGDTAAFKPKELNNFLPALAQVAEKEAKGVALNLKLQIEKREMKPFIYKHRGSLISLGQWMAIGEMADFTFWGHITWWLWRTVYLSKLISFRKKMKVALDWTVNIFSPRDISEL